MATSPPALARDTGPTSLERASAERASAAASRDEASARSQAAALEQIPGLVDLWSRTVGDERICIAVLDGPVDQSHPSLASARLTRLDSLAPGDDLKSAAARHGTHVASVIFGRHSGTVAGVAPCCSGLIIPVFGSGEDGTILPCSQVDLARAILLAVQNGAHVINISGGQFTTSGSAHALLASAVRHCAAHDVLLVAAAGNDGCDCLHLPASLPSLLAVGAMDGTGKPLGFSNWGEAYVPQGVLALGENLPGAVPGGGVELQSGTSHATAVVSGVVGLLLSLQFQHGRPASPHEIRKLILDTAAAGEYTQCLNGRLNIPETVRRVLTSGASAMVEQVADRADEAGSVAPRGVSARGSTVSAMPSCAPTDSPVATARDVEAPAAAAAVTPADCGCGCGGSARVQLVYALGQLGYDFGTEARRDSFTQHMDQPANPHDPQQLLAYLEKNPWESGSVTWTLNLDSTAIYAIKPDGAFASDAYERLRAFLREQATERVERVSVPGWIAGRTRLSNGQVVPLIHPAIRGMYNWTTKALVQAVAGTAPPANAPQPERDAYERKTRALTSFLERVYHELRNLGMMPQDRAVNYAATNAFSAQRIFEAAIDDGMELERIEVEPSPICRPESDCWEVLLTFFDSNRVFERAKRVYRFTVDVSDIVPVAVGPVRSWSVR